jgi:hypothetical protein
MGPNSHAQVQVKNCFGKPITNIKLSHRYDHDHYDSPLKVDILAHGKSSDFAQVGFWTGFLRTGKDYWHVVFDCNGREYSCKDNFYCFLTKDDKNGKVICELHKDKMVVRPPKSSNATVSLDSVKVENEGRPFYLICHRANDIEVVQRALQHGANAVECDLQYDSDHHTIYVNHDICAGAKLYDWLSGVSNLAKEQDLSAILFDCKFATKSDKEMVKKGMGLLHSSIRRHIPNHIAIVICVASLDDKDAFDPILTEGLNPNEGLSFDYKNSPQAVEDWFKSKGVKNAWYGDGIFTAGFRIGDEDTKNTRSACNIRDNRNKNDSVGIKKVYQWTLARDSSIQSAIDDDLDGVMVNPSTLHDARKIIKSSKKVHMDMVSTADDSAFLVYSF